MIPKLGPESIQSLGRPSGFHWVWKRNMLVPIRNQKRFTNQKSVSLRAVWDAHRLDHILVAPLRCQSHERGAISYLFTICNGKNTITGLNLLKDVVDMEKGNTWMLTTSRIDSRNPKREGKPSFLNGIGSPWYFRYNMFTSCNKRFLIPFNSSTSAIFCSWPCLPGSRGRSCGASVSPSDCVWFPQAGRSYWVAKLWDWNEGSSHHGTRFSTRM